MAEPAAGPGGSAPPKKERLLSLDAFRGFTILGMIFVIAVAAGGYQYTDGGLPQKMSWFGSLPISTWFHADVAYTLWEQDFKAANPGLGDEEMGALISAQPEANLKDIGVTFTDLIAPFFVFIVGAVIPLSRVGKTEDWLPLAAQRAGMLILVGVIYIALVIKQTSIWWGVLQAIGIAYFMAAATWRLSPAGRWGAIIAVGGANLLLTELWPAWTDPQEFDRGSAGFGSLSNPGGNWLSALDIHCLPWLSVSYGVMAMIGVLLGDALKTREQSAIIRQCLIVGAVFSLLGYLIHLIGFLTENYSLAFNKPIVTTSYAYFTGGLGALFFLLFYYVIDVMKISRWARPLDVFGKNPLLAYFWMILLRRILESLGLIGFFHRYENTWSPDRTAEGLNATIHNWAVYFGSEESPAGWVIALFDKSGYTGMFWGLAWTFIIWLIVLWHNRRGYFWKL